MKTAFAIIAGALLGLLGVQVLAAGSAVVLVACPVAGIALGVWSVWRQWTRITAALGLSLAFVLALAAQASGGAGVPIAPYAAALALIAILGVVLITPRASLKAVRLRH